MKVPSTLFFLITLACSMNGQAVYRDAPTGLDPVHVRITWTEQPQTKAVISWSTGELGELSTVWYSTEPIQDALQNGSLQRIDAQRNGAFSLSPDALTQAYNKAKEKDDSVTREAILERLMRIHYHHAVLKNLRPDTRYYFYVSTDGHESANYYFRTAPDRDKEFKLLAGGDSRSGLDDRKRVNRFISSLLSKDDSILAFLHGGDYVALGPSDLTQWNTWLYDLEETSSADGRILPIIPTRGNHEKVGNLYNEVFCWPGNDMNVFATQLTPSVFLITMNTNLETGGDQRIFLEESLKQSQSSTWRLVQYHQPAYPAVKAPSSALQNWVPLFEKYGVQLVIEADGHTLKRTVPIIDNKHVEGGVVYVGEGGLGVKQRIPKLDRWFLQPPGMATSAHHVQLIAFNGNDMLYEALSIDGKILDKYAFSQDQAQLAASNQ